ncbi:hypothetical protein BV20DRAFT_1052195 [Pilatotrama ljubarskyi]|nr:hypothetical protein BV20DRAFT_1052195 [Pilatotrama ljubarskyi]
MSDVESLTTTPEGTVAWPGVCTDEAMHTMANFIKKLSDTPEEYTRVREFLAAYPEVVEPDTDTPNARSPLVDVPPIPAASTPASVLRRPTLAIPIGLRVVYRKRFVRGPFHLGPLSYPIATTACVWIAFISIAFILPQANPVDTQTLNYTIVAVGIVLAYCMGFWLLSARKWFTGPIKQIQEEEGVVDGADAASSVVTSQTGHEKSP